MSIFEEGKKNIQSYLRQLDAKPGVYHMLNYKEEILYIGKAKNIKKRVSNYISQNRLTNRIQRMVAQTKKMQFIYTNTEVEALLLESNLIKKHLPPFNVLLRDDKSFPYIEITDDDFSIMKKFRGKRKKKRNYFGPFPSASSVEKTMISLQKAFKLRNCTNAYFEARSRPCLQYQIQRCTAPCVGKVSKTEYDEQRQDAIQFLKGKSRQVQKKLSEQMHQASEQLHFEKAAKLRDRIKALSSTQFKQDIHLDQIGNADFIAAYQEGEETAIEVFFYRLGANYGSKIYFPRYRSDVPLDEVFTAFLGQFYSNHTPPSVVYLSHDLEERAFLSEALKSKFLYPVRGQKKQVIQNCTKNAQKALERKLLEKKSIHKQLQDVQEKLQLNYFPKRIEVYDNSHLFGKYAYGAMVVHGLEGFDKQSYRLYKIKSDAIKGDDYGMMHEVFSRRFNHVDDENVKHYPNLILVDGGKGQLNIVYKILEEKGLLDQIDLVAISKGSDRNAGEEEFHKVGKASFQFEKKDGMLFFLQRLRDEAHRFGISRHRLTRTKELGKSTLDQIDGVGPKRKKELLNHFGSVKTLSQAGVDDIKKVAGINQSIAESIYDYFHET